MNIKVPAPLLHGLNTCNVVINAYSNCQKAQIDIDLQVAWLGVLDTFVYSDVRCSTLHTARIFQRCGVKTKVRISWVLKRSSVESCV